MKNKTKFSVIITAKPNVSCKEALAALEKVSYPKNLFEVLIAYGFSPSRQRNQAVKKARGEILYFLDNDSLIDKMALNRVLGVFSKNISQFRSPKGRGFSLIPDFISAYIVKKLFSGMIYKGEIGVVGGPTLWVKKEKIWPLLSHGILESFFAHFQMAARYRPIGSVHRATEKELILCNLAIKKNVFTKLNGFNEILYPNEENELLHRIEKNGFQLIYHPGVVAYRAHRENPGEILNTFFCYGKGRMEQIRIEGFIMNLIFLVPLVFSIYLLILIFFHPFWFFAPLISYMLISFAAAFGFSLRNNEFLLALLLPLLFFLAHVSYSLGMTRGISTALDNKRKSKEKIIVKTVKSFYR